MAKYKFECPSCSQVDYVELPMDAKKEHSCSACGSDSELIVSTRDDVLIRRAATPGQHATRNMQDVNLMQHIRNQRVKHGYRSAQEQLQDNIDKMHFRKRGDTPAKLPNKSKLEGKKKRPTKRRLDKA